jgi:hypothetical protein
LAVEAGAIQPRRGGRLLASTECAHALAWFLSARPSGMPASERRGRGLGWGYGTDALTDGAFGEILQQPHGVVLLSIVGLGMLAFAVYSLIEAHFRRIDMPT